MGVQPNDIVKVVAGGTLAGVIEVRNVFYASFGGAAQVGNPNATLDLQDWMNNVYSPLMPLVSDQLTYDHIDITNVTRDQKVALTTFSPTLVGTQSDHLIPTGVALVVRGITTVIGRQGRKFFAGFTEQNTAGLVYGATVLAAGVLAGAAWVTPFVGVQTADTWTPGIYRPTDLSFVPFTEAIVNAIPGYQRRRKQGIGV